MESVLIPIRIDDYEPEGLPIHQILDLFDVDEEAEERLKQLTDGISRNNQTIWQNRASIPSKRQDFRGFLSTISQNRHGTKEILDQMKNPARKKSYSLPYAEW